MQAGGQVFLEAGKLGLQRLAQHQNVAAVFHRHGQTNRVLPHEAHARRGWIIEPAAYIRHVFDAQGAFAHAYGETLDLFNRFEITADPQLHTLGRCLK